MTEGTYATPCGIIHYWLNMVDMSGPTLVFLPGLTADHRLFEKQIAYFENKYNVFVWDAPGHAASWPFTFDFDLMDKDRAGSCIRYNKAWHKQSGIPIEWIKGAGHNSNTDQPEIVNCLIENLLLKL